MNLRSGKTVGNKKPDVIVSGYKDESDMDESGSEPGNVTVEFACPDRDDMDVWNVRNADRRSDDDDWRDTCPICYEPASVGACECSASDRHCENGHHWHFHKYRNLGWLYKVYHTDGLEKYRCPHKLRPEQTNSCHC